MWLSYVIIAVIAVVFIAIVAKSIINKKKGKHSCSCGCSCGSCSMSELCHSKKEKENTEQS